MKINTFISGALAISLLAGACGGNQKAGSDNEQAENEVLAEGTAIITLHGGDTFDFGTVKQGKKVTHDFTFTNTGSQPLIIADVQATCGCTTPEYTKTPVNPGDDGLIKVVYDTSDQGEGAKQKTVTVTSNAAEALLMLHIKGTVN